MMDLHETFHRLCKRTSMFAGNPWAFVLGVAAVATWLITGPIFDYSDTWQLVINTSTTIITFLMVFLLQHTQNRDTLTMQLKLAELIRSIKRARSSLMDLDDLTDRELRELHKEVEKAARRARSRRKPKKS